MENKFQGGVPVPLHIHTMRPSTFPAVPRCCNINYSGGYHNNYSMPSLDPFTDHSFGFELQTHMITPQFPSQISFPSPPNLVFPNPVPLPGFLDSRMIPLVPIDYAPRPPQYLFPSPPQIPIPPPNGPPTSSLHEVNVNVVSEVGHLTLSSIDLLSNTLKGLCRAAICKRLFEWAVASPFASQSESPDSATTHSFVVFVTRWEPKWPRLQSDFKRPKFCDGRIPWAQQGQSLDA